MIWIFQVIPDSCVIERNYIDMQDPFDVPSLRKQFDSRLVVVRDKFSLPSDCPHCGRTGGQVAVVVSLRVWRHLSGSLYLELVHSGAYLGDAGFVGNFF